VLIGWICMRPGAGFWPATWVRNVIVHEIQAANGVG